MIATSWPANLAFFDIGAAGRIMDEHPEVHDWWVAGHPLGGVAAAQYAADAIAAFVSSE